MNRGTCRRGAAQLDADAVMDAAGERHVLVCLGTLDVKLVGIREDRGITVHAA